MKILVIADRAPEEDPQIVVQREGVDLVVTLGDLDLVSLAGLREVKTIPKIGVYGNHCSGTYFDSLGIQNMHLATWEFSGLTFGGFQGSLRYKPNPYAIMYTQEEASDMLKDFPYVDVMLAHSPPFGIHDEPGDLSHEGLHGLRDYIDRMHPRYFLHGHTYVAPDLLVTPHGDTQVVFVYGQRTFELH